MLVRERIALTLPPLLIRLLLAVTFLWVGLGAVFEEIEVKGERAAALANMGVIDAPAPRQSASDAGTVRLASRSQGAAPAYSADDFDTPQRVKRVHALTLLLHEAAEPGTDEDGTVRRPLWPPALAQGQALPFFAWGATLVAIFGGFFVLIGLLTRFWALLFTVLVLGAIWLLIVGPVVQASDVGSELRLLPGHEPFDVAAWMPLMWFLALLASSLALLFGGPGAASLDRAIFRRPIDDDDDDD